MPDTVLSIQDILAALENIEVADDLRQIDNALEEKLNQIDAVTEAQETWDTLLETLSNHFSKYSIDVMALVEGNVQKVFTINNDNYTTVFSEVNEINISEANVVAIDVIDQEVIETEEDEVANIPADDEEDWYPAIEEETEAENNTLEENEDYFDDNEEDSSWESFEDSTDEETYEE